MSRDDTQTTNDGLTRSGTGCIIAYGYMLYTHMALWQQWASKGQA